MSRPTCHCGVPMYARPGSKSGAGPAGYWAVFECKTLHCPKCGNGRCRMTEKAFVETR
ncbi:hypothetical protein GA0070563_11427 [Micromonospora carbonacea]|uniref:Uncharacterized protein n=2 Tax=Micromonospora carbonacea TaxID=47853 RepID=A0A1C5AKU3_9ACTN|nr:hypothetical protein GA0070563_11427 [Micromonospora carbonacea]